MEPTISILFVCLGNICRSPTAEAVFKKKVENAGLSEKIMVDSAGTTGWHEGSAPDSRTISAAKLRGYDMSVLRGRQVINEDFTRFHYIYAMDHSNLNHLNSMRTSLLNSFEKADVDIVRPALFLDLINAPVDEVPDPYHGGDEGFDYVLDLVEEASSALLEGLRREYSFR